MTDNDKDIAQLAYEAYISITQHTNKPFDHLPIIEKRAWEHTTRMVVGILTNDPITDIRLALPENQASRPTTAPPPISEQLPLPQLAHSQPPDPPSQVNLHTLEPPTSPGKPPKLTPYPFKKPPLNDDNE